MSPTAYTRRGFLGLTGGAALAAGLAACTGSSPSTSTGGEGTGSNDAAAVHLRGQLDDRPAQGAGQEVRRSRTARPPRSTPCPAPAPRSIPDKLRTELLGGKGPDVWRIWGGQIGAPFVKAKQAMDLTPYYAEVRLGRPSSTRPRSTGMTFDGVKGGVPFIGLGIGAWYNKAAFEKAGISAPPTTYAELEEANDKLVAAGITPAGPGRQVRLGRHAAVRVPAGDRRPDRSCTTSCSPAPRAGTGPRWSPRSPTSRSGRTRSGCRRARSASTRPTSSRSTCRARPPTRSPGPGPRRRRSRPVARSRRTSGCSSCPPTRARSATPASSRAT